MTKDEFMKRLLVEGFTCEKKSPYPSVVCDAIDVSKTARKVKKIAKDAGYNSSFAIRSFREGMELVTKDGEKAVSELRDAENEAAIGDTISMTEPIPMTAETEVISA